jgi:putative FmdB family regulatory protein
MPTYDYRCKACKHAFEEFQSMTAKVLKKCPACGKPALERLIGTGAALVFKGSGFYQTDYRSEGYKRSAESDKPKDAAKAETKSESKPESKSESRPESKAESKPEKKPESKSEPKSEPKSDKKSKSKKD